jgi:hypothetical protein
MAGYYTPKPKVELMLICKHCLCHFKKVDTETERDRYMFCSERCRKGWYRRQKKEGCGAVHKDKRTAECQHCGTVFEYEDWPASIREHKWCSRKCAHRAAYAKRLALKQRLKDAAKAFEASMPDHAVPIVEAKRPQATRLTYYLPKGTSLNAYTLEDDPWKSGRLPKSVTENQLYS